MRTSTGFLSGTTALFLALSPAVADEAYSPGGGRTEISLPDTAPARPAGSAVEILTGQPAMDRGGVPFDACPDTGAADLVVFRDWFTQWSVTGSFGYVMYPPGPAFQIEHRTLQAGESRSFFIADAAVEKFAWCMFPAEGHVGEDEVVVTFTVFSTDPEKCGDEPTPCEEYTTEPSQELNHLHTSHYVGEPSEYVLKVTGPETGAVTIFIGGRLGTYPTLGLATN